jgi:hypothetical protein
VQFLRDGELPLQSELRRYGVEADLFAMLCRWPIYR